MYDAVFHFIKLLQHAWPLFERAEKIFNLLILTERLRQEKLFSRKRIEEESHSCLFLSGCDAMFIGD